MKTLDQLELMRNYDEIIEAVWNDGERFRIECGEEGKCAYLVNPKDFYDYIVDVKIRQAGRSHELEGGRDPDDILKEIEGA